MHLIKRRNEDKLKSEHLGEYKRFSSALRSEFFFFFQILIFFVVVFSFLTHQINCESERYNNSSH